MRSVKKILMGIAITLFGISVAIGGNVFIYIGWAISLVGVILSFIGYYFTEDDTP